ncbi:fibroblast growth factor 4A-like [Notothenia coriiceps]|uniref:Nucleoside diphosphate-linked moiety X motif 6 n=1 Tax=Notothenia coriiceps TaxID=8208 RepID=A0A6I9P697_9TELE|nr:PREDICTED: fibroblast growth factor 4A-like [Notothenia coriiceps]
MAACAFASRFFPLVRGRVCCRASSRACPAFRTFSCTAARAQGSGALTGREDRFGGVTVNLSDSCLPEDISEKSFSRLLKDSLVQWKSEGKVAVWLRVPISLSRCAAAASEHGFSFHHAKHDHTVLSLWLGEGESRLPGFATHQIGVAGYRNLKKPPPYPYLWKLGMASDRRATDECYFLERLESNNYNTYRSRKYPDMYVALKRNGQYKPGSKTSRGQKAILFLPMAVKARRRCDGNEDKVAPSTLPQNSCDAF